MTRHESKPPDGRPPLPIARLARLFERTGYIFQGAARRLRRRFAGPGKAPLTIAIVMPLTGAAANWLQGIKFDWLDRYGVSRGLEAAPHVTLKMGCQVRELAPIAQYLGQLAAQTDAPTIGMQDAGRFPDGVMFLDVATTPPLDRLRRRIVADLQDQFGIVPEELEGDAFHFHATIGFGLPAAACDAEYQRLQAGSHTFVETASAMEIWVHVGANWAPYFRAPFKAPSPLNDVSCGHHG